MGLLTQMFNDDDTVASSELSVGHEACISFTLHLWVPYIRALGLNHDGLELTRLRQCT